ncbi:hypothetical protein OIU77_006540 [Salix suchowensis]|uniref:SAC9 second GBDL domain-containing protein n=1 Tax=Salix suchowensis TaxID=1278906 RepID=A0ABQ9AL02_9ROSI|nr:hypothetical protein OIU77_006540 [Salix suchowensis]
MGTVATDRLSSSQDSSAQKYINPLLGHKWCAGSLVETATDSAPFLSLESGSRQSYWKGPPTTAYVEFVTVLGTLSDVIGVILLASSCGYSVTDSPTVSAPVPSLLG